MDARLEPTSTKSTWFKSAGPQPSWIYFNLAMTPFDQAQSWANPNHKTEIYYQIKNLPNQTQPNQPNYRRVILTDWKTRISNN